MIATAVENPGWEERSSGSRFGSSLYRDMKYYDDRLRFGPSAGGTDLWKKLFGGRASRNGHDQTEGQNLRIANSLRMLPARMREDMSVSLYDFFNKRAYKASWTVEVLEALKGMKGKKDDRRQGFGSGLSGSLLGLGGGALGGLGVGLANAFLGPFSLLGYAMLKLIPTLVRLIPVLTTVGAGLATLGSVVATYNYLKNKIGEEATNFKLATSGVVGLGVEAGMNWREDAAKLRRERTGSADSSVFNKLSGVVGSGADITRDFSVVISDLGKKFEDMKKSLMDTLKGIQSDSNKTAGIGRPRDLDSRKINDPTLELLSSGRLGGQN